MSSPGSPLISIITVTYNAADAIVATLNSITALKSDEIEFIIIDGASTDETVSIIEKYKKKITYFKSEADNGIYDAMNKAIKQSSGNYLYFINCGDKLLNIPIDILTMHLKTEVKVLAFPVIDSLGNVRMPAINILLKIKNLLPHQGCFYKSDLNFLYDLKYKVFSDFDLNQKLYVQKQPIKVFKAPIIASHDITGISNEKQHGKEIFRVVNGNFGKTYKYLSFAYFKLHGLKRRMKF